MDTFRGLRRTGVAVALAVWGGVVALSAPAGAVAEEAGLKALASSALSMTRRKGGICVHLGCGDGKLTAELVQHSRFYVHGLAWEQRDVERARTLLQSLKLYERSAVEEARPGGLPYLDDLVNLLVVDSFPEAEKRGVTLAEIFRVLTPHGVACLGRVSDDKVSKATAGGKLKGASVTQADGWVVMKKAWPDELDDWTHVRHGPDGNLYSTDEAVAPPKNIKWIAGPLWQKHFNGSPMVRSAAGRLFYIINEATPDGKVPHLNHLIARDAFNGKQLWKLPLKSGFQPMAFVATANHLYGVIKGSGPLVALDASTGETIKTYAGTSPAKALLYKGLLILEEKAGIRAMDPKTGDQKWVFKRATMMRYGYRMTTFVAGGGSVCFLSKKEEIVCLDALDGRKKWEVPLSSRLPSWSGGYKKTKVYANKKVMFCNYFKDVLILGGRGGVFAISSKDGKPLWDRKYPIYYKRTFAEISCFDGLVWLHIGSPKSWTGLDPQTGKELKTVKYPTFPKVSKKAFGKGRCYPDKVTARYFITEEMCFLERTTSQLKTSSIARGSCDIGYIPANGLLYAFPEQCGCYPMTRGLLALSSAPQIAAGQEEASEKDRFRRGEAFGNSGEPPGQVIALSETHQIQGRNGNGKPVWTFTAGGRVDASPTIHKGLCLFGCRDGWVYCLNAANGKLAWRFRAAPVERRMGAFSQLESPWPVTGKVLVQDGIAYFSAGRHSRAEGGIKVYAVEAETGKVRWQGSPTKRITVNSQLRIKGSSVSIGRALLSLKTGACLK